MTLIERLRSAHPDWYGDVPTLYSAAADRLEAAEKLVEQIIPALENGMIYQQDTKGYYGLYDQTRQALAAAKQFREGEM